MSRQPRTTLEYCHDARRSAAYPAGCVNLASDDCAHCGKLHCPDHLQASEGLSGLFCDACASWIRESAHVNQMQADYMRATMMLAEIGGPICDAATVHLQHVMAYLASTEHYTIGVARGGVPRCWGAYDRIEQAQLRDRAHGEGPAYRSTVEAALGPGPWPTKREGG